MKCPMPHCKRQLDKLTAMTGRTYWYCEAHGPLDFTGEDRNDEKVSPAAVVIFVTLGLALALAVLWRLLK